MPRNRSRNSFRNRRARRGRRSLRSSGYKMVVPFYYSGEITASGTKQITAGDLGLDLTRPLRLTAVHFTASLTALYASNVTIVITLVADGQEGTVSRPYVLGAHYPTRIHVRQSRMMDFGVYGSEGSLAIIAHTASVEPGQEKVFLVVAGKAVIEYKQSQTLHVVSSSSPNECDAFIRNFSSRSSFVDL